MDTTLIGELIKLRYKLLWAKTRSRNGRIAMFLAGYLILVGVLVLLTTGGFGAALLAVRSGKAQLVAQAVLGGIFLEAAFASTILGWCLAASFWKPRSPAPSWDSA
jgi:dolichol kinase